MSDVADVAIVGGGAAGLMAAIAAGRRAPGRRLVVLDGARTLGAKILIAGGGRCNVTHEVVTERDFAGSSPHAIRKVLRRFDVAATVGFFAELGVALKREETGKLFPTTDRARTVLDALLGAARAAGAELRHPWRVETIDAVSGGFVLAGPAGTLRARRVVLATGGRSVPTTGSDGHGHLLARRLGHGLTPRILPALVPLVVAPEHFVTALAGVTVPATLAVEHASGKRVTTCTGSLLCTHRGVSGPVVLDVSRHWLHARLDVPDARLVACWLPGARPDTIDAMLRDLGAASPGRLLSRHLPERLARALCAAAGVDPAVPGRSLSRAQRRALAGAVGASVLPVIGDRGFTHAEATAGGVPLAELRLETLASRVTPGLHVCGEVCDVDGRIGGFNFQWAWASGHVAGCGAVAAD